MKFRFIFYLVIGMLPMLLSNTAIAVEPPQRACIDDSICSRGNICERGVCVAGCRNNTQCTQGKVCFNNKCINPTGSGICKPGSKRSCYDGSAKTKGVGVCKAGEEFCTSLGKWSGKCSGQVLPEIEKPDNKDNDCNGKVDDGVVNECKPGTKRVCYTGPQGTINVGVCKSGVQYCNPDSRWDPCKGQVIPLAETKDGKDNDCNGKVDDIGGGSGYVGASAGSGSSAGQAASASANTGLGATGNSDNAGRAGASANGFTVQVPWKTQNVSAAGAVLKCQVYNDKCAPIATEERKLSKNLNVASEQVESITFSGANLGSAAMVKCTLTSALKSSEMVSNTRMLPGKMASCRP